ncbi:MAG TPA: hypothetical protein VMY18_13595 [Acidobacteriota bacterium]|nr:hypothetical protein [Acidobacteriota bacterium]
MELVYVRNGLQVACEMLARKTITLVILVVGSFLLLPPNLAAAKLQAKTVAAWEEYVRGVELRISEELNSNRGFLVQDFLSDDRAGSCREQIRQDDAACILELGPDGDASIEVPGGLVHHWYGGILVPEAKVEQLVRWVQNYDRHSRFFDDVEVSKLLSRQGDVFKIYLRLMRKKVITVYYNTEHRVEYQTRGNNRVSSSSTATRIKELTAVGTEKEREQREGKEYGFLWRLNSYWRFQQVPEGVIIGCESLSLSRGIPALAAFVGPFVKSVPRETLTQTLVSIRDGYAKTSGVTSGE